MHEVVGAGDSGSSVTELLRQVGEVFDCCWSCSSDSLTSISSLALTLSLSEEASEESGGEGRLVNDPPCDKRGKIEGTTDDGKDVEHEKGNEELIAAKREESCSCNGKLKDTAGERAFLDEMERDLVTERMSWAELPDAEGDGLLLGEFSLDDFTRREEIECLVNNGWWCLSSRGGGGDDGGLDEGEDDLLGFGEEWKKDGEANEEHGDDEWVLGEDGKIDSDSGDLFWPPTREKICTINI